MASAPDEKLHGEIAFGSTAGATVDLYGSFSDEDGVKSKLFTLHGTTFDDQLISLFRCHIPKTVRHRPGAAHSKLSSSFGIVGAHVDDAEDLRFTELKLQLTHLREWVNISGIQRDLSVESNQLAYKHEFPRPIEFGSIGGISASIEFSSLACSEPLGQLILEEECELVLTAMELAAYDEFQTLVEAVQAFLCIAVQRPVIVSRCIGDCVGLNNLRPSGKRSRQITFIRRVSSALGEPKRMVPEQMLFARSELNEPLTNVFGRFALKREQLRPALDLYLSTVYSTDQVPRAVYLTLAQALEGYHRVTMGGSYLDDETYHSGIKQTLINALPATLGRELRASLVKKFDYLHEYSLRKRIAELMRMHANVLEGVLGKPSVFASIVSELRNTLTHPSAVNPPESQEHPKVWRLSQSMALLLEVCFLSEFGITEQQILQIVQSRSDRARRIHFSSR